MKWKYRGAGVLFWRKNDQGEVEVLLGHRSPGSRHAPGVWSSFGGGRNRGESARDNAVREALEETAAGMGWRELPPAHFRMAPRPDRRVAIPFVYEFAYWFVEVIGAPPGWPRGNWGHTELRWFSVGELPEPLHGQTRRLVRRVRGREGGHGPR